VSERLVGLQWELTAGINKKVCNSCCVGTWQEPIVIHVGETSASCRRG
jgi:hypothetical protein